MLHMIYILQNFVTGKEVLICFQLEWTVTS